MKNTWEVTKKTCILEEDLMTFKMRFQINAKILLIEKSSSFMFSGTPWKLDEGRSESF